MFDSQQQQQQQQQQDHQHYQQHYQQQSLTSTIHSDAPDSTSASTSASSPQVSPHTPTSGPSLSPTHPFFASGPSVSGRLGAGLGVGGASVSTASATPSSVLSAPQPRSRSPVHFAATTDAFGLRHTHHAPPPPSTPTPFPPQTSPAASPNAATPTRRLRRPSLLSLAPPTLAAASRPETIVEPATADPDQDTEDPDDIMPSSLPATTVSLPATTVYPQPVQRWGVSPISPLTSISGAMSSPPLVESAPNLSIEGLTTRTSPAGRPSTLSPPVEMDEPRGSPLNWAAELNRRRASRGAAAGAGDDDVVPPKLPFSGRPLPGALLATLISESTPLEHEMRSEARYQRLISSHPSVFPLTPRQRRNTRWTRGRFPETVGDDDDDDEDTRQPRSRWMSNSSDSDSDEMMDEAPDWQGSMSGAAGAVNSAFASVMDLDRPPSSGSSGTWGSGKNTPGSRNGAGAGAGAAPTPPPQWKGARTVAPSPGTGLQLPTAFGGLGMGIATPLGSPTVEKMELAASPSTLPSTPGMMMQYREPASGRPGKRKAAEDRFDPYKRPRGSSPSPFASATLSPSKSTSIPIPSSPSHHPLVGSALAMGSPGHLSLGAAGRPKHAHPYTRPMASRSRAASPALSIGSTSGVLSTSLGNGGLVGPSRPLAGPFIPTGPGATAAVTAASTPGAAPSSLGGLGLLSIGAAGAVAPQDDAMEED